MRVNTSPRHKNAPRIAEKSAVAFLQWVRGRDCLFVDTGECEGKIEAMHLDFAGGKGIGSKVADRFTIPACTAHHARQHRIGWNTFVAAMGTTKPELLRAAEILWRAWGGRLAWERKVAGNG